MKRLTVTVLVAFAAALIAADAFYAGRHSVPDTSAKPASSATSSTDER